MNLKLRRPLLAVLGGVASIGIAFASGSILSATPTNAEAEETYTTFVDVLSQEQIGITGTDYVDFGPIGGFPSGAQYSGNCAGGNDSIQLRSKTNTGYPGVISSSTGGTLGSIEFDWNSATSDGRTIQIFASNDPISSTEALFDGSLKSVGTVTMGNTAFTFTDSYQYFGIRSASNALYLNSISVTWKVPGEIVEAESVNIIYDGPTTITSLEEPFQLEAEVLPADATNKEVKWTSSNYEVLDVSNTGLVTPVSNGNATITATSVQNDEVYDSVDFVVDAKPIAKDHILDNSVVGGSYPSGEEKFTDQYVEFGYENVMKGKGGFQFKARSGSLRNLDRVERLAFVKLTRSSEITDSNLSKLSVVFGSTSSSLNISSSGVLAENGMDYIFYVPRDSYLEVAYFRIENLTGNAGYCTNIEVHTLSDDEMTEAESWASEFLNSSLCDGGVTAPSISLWNQLSESFSSLSLEAKYYIAGFEGNEASENAIEQMIARYEYIVAKYGASTYEDFMERSPEPSSYGYNAGMSIEAKNTATWIAVIGLFTCTVLAGSAFIIKRRREEK